MYTVVVLSGFSGLENEHLKLDRKSEFSTRKLSGRGVRREKVGWISLKYIYMYEISND